MISRATLSGIVQGQQKFRSMLAGNTAFIPTDFDSIATATVGSAGVVTFSSIPSTYRHLQIRYMAGTSSSASAYMRLNGDTGSNYAWHYFNGPSIGAGGYTSQTSIGISPAGSGMGTAQFTVGIIDLIDYQSTAKNKTVRAYCSLNVNGTGSDVSLQSGLWTNTSAVNSITITTFGVDFRSGSTFALYGIQGV